MSSMVGGAAGRSPRFVSNLAFDILIVAAGGLATLLALRGPGTDNDIYALVATWRYLLEFGVYIPSRETGYPVAELIVGLGAELFSWKAVGLLSVPAAVAAGYFMLRCLHEAGVHGARTRLALAACGRPLAAWSASRMSRTAWGGTGAADGAALHESIVTVEHALGWHCARSDMAALVA